ncbi:hypothetical protein H6P81_011505 [Aristolochia fimbriata]|uniref:Uncharacterized protein n=1 Tax=Aristolochia fimbriata TaxID=158543 RepID=A0AAV7ETY3_ARIFI|nr:hypothetical protein H6P81_011505 [Aristolochia fimbriata]
MSLSLLQGYSSAEENVEEDMFSDDSSLLSDGDGEGYGARIRSKGEKSVFDLGNPTSNSSLPSAFDAFSEVAGPPAFLNNFVDERSSVKEVEQKGRYGGRKNKKEKKDLPAGAVVESKPQLVAIRDRVRTDVEGTVSPASSTGLTGQGKRVVSATNPEPKDAADLLRMCIQCGIPKTYSNATGMVCPQCGDRPPADPDIEAAKKKGSTIKDKEKSKRMRGQSSHATWKSETEMQLRQQFD